MKEFPSRANKVRLALSYRITARIVYQDQHGPFLGTLFTSDGSGSKFFGFGLRSGMRFRVGFFRVSIAKQVSGLIGFGFKAKINFRVRV